MHQNKTLSPQLRIRAQKRTNPPIHTTIINIIHINQVSHRRRPMPLTQTLIRFFDLIPD
jgi:hypothetical protein